MGHWHTLEANNTHYVLPDTSWLLEDKKSSGHFIASIDQAEFDAAKPRSIWRKITRSTSKFFGGYSIYEIPPTWIILDEVLNEIAQLHKASDGPCGTGSAKEFINSVLNCGKYVRVDASNIPRIELIEPKLGIDSRTDHAIVSTAIAMSRDTPVTSVIVLTNDAGMKVELDAQHRDFGHRVFWGDSNCHRSPDFQSKDWKSNVAKFLVGKVDV